MTTTQATGTRPDGTPSPRVYFTAFQGWAGSVARFTPEHDGRFPEEVYSFGRAGSLGSLFVPSRAAALAAGDWLMEHGYELGEPFRRYAGI